MPTSGRIVAAQCGSVNGEFTSCYGLSTAPSAFVPNRSQSFASILEFVIVKTFSHDHLVD